MHKNFAIKLVHRVRTAPLAPKTIAITVDAAIAITTAIILSSSRIIVYAKDAAAA